MLNLFDQKSIQNPNIGHSPFSTKTFEPSISVKNHNKKAEPLKITTD